MLRPFHLLQPDSIEDATSELDRLGERVAVYAGGAELVLLMRNGVVAPEYVMNIKRIPSLTQYAWAGDVLHIGAAVSHARIAREPTVQQRLPVLASAESQVANPRVRSQGTLGGNLCFSDPHSDPHSPLLVHEATAVVAGKGGSRELPMDDFLVGSFETALQPGELLSEIRVPPLPTGYVGAYMRTEHLPRPTLNVAAAVLWHDGRVADARLAVGCIGPRSFRLVELEGKIKGLTADEAEQVLLESKGYLEEKLEPESDILGSRGYKLHLAQVNLRRALAMTTHSGGGE